MWARNNLELARELAKRDVRDVGYLVTSSGGGRQGNWIP